jgi:hypothetical protein
MALFWAGCGWLSAAAVNYKDLAATRLPYGEAITINGSTRDFVASDSKLGNVVISDWATIRKISVSVTVEGLSPRTPVDVTLTGTTWSVAVESFPKNASVKFDFKIAVDLNADKVGQIVDALLKDEKFNQAAGDFFKATQAHVSVSATATAKTAYVTAIAPIVKTQLPGFVAPTDVKPLADSLSAAGDAWLSVRADLDSLTNLITREKLTGLKGVTPASTPTEAFAKLKGIGTVKDVEQIEEFKKAQAQDKKSDLIDRDANNLLAAIQPFLADYQSAVAIFQGLIADLPVSLQLTDVSTVQDFAKYAGIDVGALYAPPARSLRSFFTINVYLGSVEDSPAAATPCQDGVSSKSMKALGRRIADAQKRIGEARDFETEKNNDLRAREAALKALLDANAANGQIAAATEDRNSAQQLAIAATAARQQAERMAASAISPPSGRACTFKDSVFWQVFQQRFSISGGVSLGDISGQKNPPFANNYAFVAGGGWRLNKYVRAFVGDMLYRNKFTDRVNHTACFGFSVDFSALGNITSVFGKVK